MISDDRGDKGIDENLMHNASTDDTENEDVAAPGSDTADALGAVGTATAAGMASFGGTSAGMTGAIIGGTPDDIEQGLATETNSVDQDIEEYRNIGLNDQAGA